MSLGVRETGKQPMLGQAQALSGGVVGVYVFAIAEFHNAAGGDRNARSVQHGIDRGDRQDPCRVDNEVA